MNEIVTQVNIIQTAVLELQCNLNDRENKKIAAQVGDIKTAIASLKQILGDADHRTG
jgi:hypothetical protein